MKVTDLMIGDWVKINDSNYQVQVIKKKGVIKLYEMTQYGEHEIQLNTDFIEDFIEPIPLTKEILLKNGFEDFSGGGCIIKKLSDDEIPTLYIWDGNDSLYVVDYYSANTYTYIKDCKYAHEFQHELKSCGIEKEIVL